MGHYTRTSETPNVIMLVLWVTGWTTCESHSASGLSHPHLENKVVRSLKWQSLFRLTFCLIFLNEKFCLFSQELFFYACECVCEGENMGVREGCLGGGLSSPASRNRTGPFTPDVSCRGGYCAVSGWAVEVCVEQGEHREPWDQSTAPGDVHGLTKSLFPNVRQGLFLPGICCEIASPVTLLFSPFPGRASHQLLLGREQQCSGPARPQPALPWTVSHRLWAVQGDVCSPLSLGLWNSLGSAGLPLVPVIRWKRRFSDKLPRVCLWAK